MVSISNDLKTKITQIFCKKHNIVPIMEDNTVAIFNVLNYDENLKSNLEEILGKTVEFKISHKNDIFRKIEEIYNYDINKEIKDITSKEIVDNQASLYDEDSPAVRVLNYILDTSIQLAASDIHIEPLFVDVLVRIRVDGSLVKLKKIPNSLYQTVVSRIKILSSLDISEKRLPQDGRFSYNFGKENIDIRVAIIPTGNGEKVVLRILDIQRIAYTPEGIGLYGENLTKIMSLINQPSGLILCCGPTSSGKTSTLYTLLKRLNKTDINIMTIEDPIEYKIEGINQIEVNHNTGLDFEKGLMSILRMDPDKIMIGEIRSSNTANIAISSSITGHLVLSTLHTESSPSSINRLINMGIEPYLVSAGLIGVISQRLIRKLCPDCKKKVKNNFELIDSDYIYKAVGCSKCNNGYLGRNAVYEIMIVDNEIRELIISRKSTAVIKSIAIKKGMTTLSDEILKLIKNGETTMEEYFKNIHTLGGF